MTVQEMLDEFTDHGFGDVAVARQLAFLNGVYLRVCSKAPWPLLETELSNTVATATKTITMPSDWRKTKQIAVYDPAVGATDTISIKPERYDYLRNAYWDLESSSVQARPMFYYFKGTAINLFPIPDRTYQVVHQYYKVPTKLLQTDNEAAVLVPPSYHETVLVPGALVKLYTMEDDPELAAEFKQDFQEGFFEMYQELLVPQIDKPEHIYYSDPDEYTY